MSALAADIHAKETIPDAPFCDLVKEASALRHSQQPALFLLSDSSPKELFTDLPDHPVQVICRCPGQFLVPGLMRLIQVHPQMKPALDLLLTANEHVWTLTCRFDRDTCAISLVRSEADEVEDELTPLRFAVTPLERIC